MSEFEFHTFGCKVNTYDTGLLESRLAPVKTNRKIHIVNSCAVTANATDEALRLARKLKRLEPQAVVVLTGCSAQVDTEKIRQSGAADLIVANSHKTEIKNILQEYLDKPSSISLFKSNIFNKADVEPGGGIESQHSRAFLKIQDGCNSFCTFCVIPFARGKSRSVSAMDLVDRINELHGEPVNEVVLTGVHIGDYRDDQRFGLEDLIEQILLKTRMPRLRLSSLEPLELTERLLDLFSSDRLCPHFHMSLQSANSKVLKQMKRMYAASDVEHSLQRIERRVPQAFVGIDVIAGFPGETEAEFNDSRLRLEALPWTRLHVFPYSQRPLTFAARMDAQVDSRQITRRAEILRNLSQIRFLSVARKQIGSTKQVLPMKNSVHGLSRDYWSVAFDKFNLSEPEAFVFITDADDQGRLRGIER